MTRQINIGVITRYTEANYHGTLLYGIHQWARSHNVNLFVINTYMINRFYSNSQKIDVFYHTAFKHIDGWIILTEGANPEYISALDKSEKPIVLVGFNREDYKYTIIKDDGKFGAKTIVEHLIIHGHKRIGFIGWMELDDMRERFKGYKETLEEHNIALDPNLVYITGNAIPKDGKEAVRYWLKNNIDFSAVFAANDGIAIGVIEALKEAGFRLPKDIAVIGYDNSSLAKNINPSLSSMNQNILEIGMGAAEALIDEINKNSYSGRTIFIKSSLVCRRSCGCKYDYEDNSELSRDNINLKDTMIRCLEDAIYKNSDVGAKLLTTSIDEIKKLFPQIVDNYSWECIGFWDEDCNGKSSLNIKRVYNSYTK
ncbi:MAG: substrate-binding domain-containing protein, partial [Bacillota bacterium]|nr:substrate-binding domain-containing protein [Bacillota bacterium]